MIRNKVKLGLIWSFTDNLLQQIVNFTVGVILARILTPEDFGLLGIITVFIAFSNVFVNSGFSEALINKKDVKSEDYDTVFWVNIIIGLIVFVILYLVAPYIAFFFKKNELTLLIRFTSLSVVFMSLSSIQRTIMTKTINFKTISIVSLIAVSISGLTGVLMAINGHGIISLVVRMVLGQFITFLAFWLSSKWRPRFNFNIRSFKSMFNYGKNLFIIKVINSLFNNLYYSFIGKFFSASVLGFYTRAESFKNLASSNIINTVQRVSFSVLSSKSNEKSKILLFREINNGTFFLTSFLMSILFICSNEIILILVGEKWIISTQYLKILTLSGLFLPIYSLNTNFFAVQNKTKLYMKIDVGCKLFVIPVILIGYFSGIILMLYGIVVSSILSYLVSLFYLNRIFNHKVKEQLFLIFKGISLFILSFLLSEKVNMTVDEHLYFNFLIKFISIIIVFSFGLMFLFPALLNTLKSFNFFNLRK